MSQLFVNTMKCRRMGSLSRKKFSLYIPRYQLESAESLLADSVTMTEAHMGESHQIGRQGLTEWSWGQATRLRGHILSITPIPLCHYSLETGRNKVCWVPTIIVLFPPFLKHSVSSLLFLNTIVPFLATTWSKLLPSLQQSDIHHTDPASASVSPSGTFSN